MKTQHGRLFAGGRVIPGVNREMQVTAAAGKRSCRPLAGMARGAVFYILAALVAAVLSSCATAPPQGNQVILWPSPPQMPRLAFIRSYHGQRDYKKTSILDAVAGQEAVTLGIGKAYGVSARNGLIYLADTMNSDVMVIDTVHKKVLFLGMGGQGRLKLPLGIAVASDGRVFVSDGAQKTVFVYGLYGKLVMALGHKGEFKDPAGLAINNKLHRLYVVDSFGQCVHVYDSNTGQHLFNFGKRGDGNGDFNYPSNIAIDRRNGNVLVTDTQNFRVEVFDKDGHFLRKMGTLGDRPGQFARPKGIGVDSEGHVYVVDAAFDNLQIFNDKGRLLLFLGAAGSAPGYFEGPAGMYVGRDDKIYISDTFNHRIQVFQYLSAKWKAAHPDKMKEYQMYNPKAAKPAPKKEAAR